MKYYKISEEDLTSLIEKAKFLDELEAGGVDNWYGYEMAYNGDLEVSEEDYEDYGAKEVSEIDGK